MTLVGILIAAIVTIIVYLVVKWLLGILKVAYPEVLLQVLALLLFLLIVIGRINLGI